VARYTSELVRALAQAFPDDEFILVSDQKFDMPCTAGNVRAGQPPDNIWERRWWTFGLQRELKRQGAQVFHGVDFAVPFPATMPAVMTIHDLSPWIHASWVNEAWRARSARVRKRVPWMIRSGAAQHIITPTEAIRHEVIRRFGVAPERVTAIPLAAADHFQPHAETTAAHPYFLYAGMLEPRKNAAAAIAAWSAVRERFPVDLVIAGPQREDFVLPPHAPGLYLRGVVSEDQLAKLYAGAVALLYPSHYEGFGLPILEAMQCGTPVIISPDPALMETAGDAAMVEGTIDGMARAMESLLQYPGLRDDIRCRSLKRAAHFSWERTARATRQIYRSMLPQ